MKTRQKIATLLLLMASIARIDAHIGWTMEQCRQAYGKETSCYIWKDYPKVTIYTFDNARFEIYVHFMQGAATAVEYYAKDKTSFTRDTVLDLLSQNNPDPSQTWEEFEDVVPNARHLFQLGDEQGNLIASADYYDKTDPPKLIVMLKQEKIYLHPK